jgi:hypothetical protein
MRSILTHIAIVALLLHVTLGCCAHHAHAAARFDGNDHATTADHVHRHAAEEEPCSSDQDREHCPSDRCDELQCSFLRLAKSSPVKPASLAVWLFGLTGFGGEFATTRPVVLGDVSVAGAPPLAVRGHVLFQVFLI